MNPQQATTFDQFGGSMALAARQDTAKAFRRAKRHSRRVRILRIAIPVALVLIVGGFTLATWFDPLRLLYRLPGDIAGITISGTKVTMVAPKLSGYTKDSRWYEFSASAAAQDLTKPDEIELKGVRAMLDLEDKSKLMMVADGGMFDRKAGLLTLTRNIVLTTTSGFRVDLAEAVIDIATGDVVSNKPVEVNAPEANVKANGLEVVSGGDIIRFEGNVRMLVTPNDSEPGGEQP